VQWVTSAKRIDRVKLWKEDPDEMSNAVEDRNAATLGRQGLPPSVSKSVEWYHEGDERTVEAGGVQITIRFVGRKGRRGRIAITAPPGATFQTSDRPGTDRSPDRLT
jgi:hypothetical protein